MDTDYVEIANRIKVKDCIKIQIDAEVSDCLSPVSRDQLQAY